MGLFKFLKDAGAKLLGGSAQAATPEALKQQVESHGFDSGKLNIDLHGDKVKLSGQAMTQEEAEKIILSLGNTVGVAEVDTSELQVQKPAAQSTMYTVQKGDTLWEIAEKHYGKGKGAKYTEIVKANSPPEIGRAHV
jgi:nucleoid-associated protein YgaU